MAPSSEQARIGVKELNQNVMACIMEKTSALLSQGRRCTKDGFGFVWPPGQYIPYFVTPEGNIIRLEVIGDIPYLKPGHPLCQPIKPSVDYPDYWSKGRSKTKVATTSSTGGSSSSKGPVPPPAEVTGKDGIVRRKRRFEPQGTNANRP